MIVEDEPLIAALLEDWLLELGCSVAGPAPTVAAALELIRLQAPDAAILDVKLMGEDSIPVANALGQMGVPVVYASGGTMEELDGLQGPQPASLLKKPYDFEAVRAAIEQLQAASARRV